MEHPVLLAYGRIPKCSTSQKRSRNGRRVVRKLSRSVSGPRTCPVNVDFLDQERLSCSKACGVDQWSLLLSIQVSELSYNGEVTISTDGTLSEQLRQQQVRWPTQLENLLDRLQLCSDSIFGVSMITMRYQNPCSRS